MKKRIGLLLVLILVLPSGILPVLAETTPRIVGNITLLNVSGDGYPSQISMTKPRSFEATVPLPAGTTEAEAKKLARSVTWSLTRETGALDPSIYPYPYLGDSLNKFTVKEITGKTETTTKPFQRITTSAVTLSSYPGWPKKYGLQLKFQTSSFFRKTDNVDTVQNSGASYMDYVGTYHLRCLNGDQQLGYTDVAILPYDSYHIRSEITAQLNDLVRDARKRGRYAKVASLGKSAEGRDIPYLLIADSKKTVDDYLSLKKQAETNPEALLRKLKNGTLRDFKLPILYSNIHGDETVGTDAAMEFADMLIHQDSIRYRTLSGFTPAGEKELARLLKSEKKEKLLGSGLGYLYGSGPIDLEKYYTLSWKTLDVKDLLQDVFFLIVPSENVDGQLRNIRQNGNGFDLSQDALFQTQPETQHMAKLIADWNPISMIEFHGHAPGLRINLCAPPHNPNFEYDLFFAQAMAGADAFGAAAVANNQSLNNDIIPLRDDIKRKERDTQNDQGLHSDYSVGDTAHYAMLHGTSAYSVNVPYENEENFRALYYGMFGHAQQVADQKRAYLQAQLEFFQRGINNTDADTSLDRWYENADGAAGAEANLLRPKYAKNSNFFPEYYVIPLDPKIQRNLDGAYALHRYLRNNGVKVSQLSSSVRVGKNVYPAGSLVVDMHQAKRNVANCAFYDGALLSGWPPSAATTVTAFGKTLGLTCDAVDQKNIFRGALKDANTPIQGKSSMRGIIGKPVVVSNDSIAAVQAVNTLLSQKQRVSVITSGVYRGDFLISYPAYQKVSHQFVLNATTVDTLPVARPIKKLPTLYVPGASPAFRQTRNGNPYGARDAANLQNEALSNDRYVYGAQLGFPLTDDPAKADLIAGSLPLDKKALKLVKEGTPYFATGPQAMDTVKRDLLRGTSLQYATGKEAGDALVYVSYPTDSLTTASHAAAGDDIFYIMGSTYLKTIPKDAEALLRVANQRPLSGYFPEASLKPLLGQVQAFSYQTDQLDLTVFANAFTPLAHAQDEYRFASDTFYSKVLGEFYE